MTVLWQYSDDGGKTWTNNGELHGLIKTHLDEGDWKIGLEEALETNDAEGHPRIWRLIWERNTKKCVACGQEIGA